MSKPDPQAVGEWLLKAREEDNEACSVGLQVNSRTFAELCNLIPWDEMPQMKSTSSVDTTVQQYVDECYEAAKNGDKYAARQLVRLGLWHVCETNNCDTPIPLQVLNCEAHRPKVIPSTEHWDGLGDGPWVGQD